MKTVVRLWIYFALFVAPSAFALDNPAQFNFDGVLLDNSNNPITSATSVTFQIYNPAANCLLYEETQTVTPDSTGAFSAPVGSGTRAPANDGGQSWNTIFSNKGVVRSSGTNCASGYTPAANDGRKLRVTVAGNVLTPDFSISSAPFATTADTLQGYIPTDFLSTSGGSVQSQNPIRFYDAGNTNYIAVKAPAATATYSLVLPASAGTNGQVLSTDGSGNLSWIAAGGGGLPATGGSMTGAILMGGNNITGTGDILMNAQKTLGLGVFTNAQQSGLGLGVGDKGKTWYNTDTGSMMFWDGATARSLSPDVSNISSGTGKYFTYMPNNTACTNGQFLMWNNGNSRWECGTGGTGDLSSAGNSIGGPINLGTNDNYDLVFRTNATSKGIVTAQGRFGVGTVSPTAGSILDVNGAGTGFSSMVVPRDTTANRPTGVDGMIRYNTTLAKFEVFENGGWTNVVSSAPVTTVAGRTGAVVLDVADIGSGVGKYFTYMPNGTACANGQLMQWNTSTTRWECSTSTWLKHGGNSIGAALNVGTTDAYALNLVTNSTTKMVVTSAGEVGIGTTAPAYPFQVGSSFGATQAAMFYGSVKAAYGNTGIQLPLLSYNNYNATGDGAGVGFIVGSNANPRGVVAGVIESGTDGGLQFQTLSANTLVDRMVIDSAGKVGLSNATPAVSLDVSTRNDAIAIAVGNSGQRPGVGPSGMLRYNTDINDMEMFDGVVWRKMSPVSLTTFAGGYSDGSVATSTTYYTYPNGHSQIHGGTPSTTDYPARTRNVVSHGGKLKNLYIKMTQDPASTWVFSVLINGSPSGLTCTVNNGFSSCNDTTNSPLVSPGDEIGMKIDTGANGAAAKAVWAFDLVSP